MSIEDLRQSGIDNTSANTEFSEVAEQHLNILPEAEDGPEVAQAQPASPVATDAAPVEAAATAIPTLVKPDDNNVVTLPATVDLDNLEFEVAGNDLVLVLADGTEITVQGGAANIPTFVIGEVELPQVVLFAALEDSNINVAAGPDGSFSAQAGSPSNGADFNDDPYGDGPAELGLIDLLGDTSFGDEFRTAQIFGGNGRPSIDEPLEEPFGFDEALIADATSGNESFSGRLPFNPGADDGTISAIGFVAAGNVDEEGSGSSTTLPLTSGGVPVQFETFPAPADGTVLDFLALRGFIVVDGVKTTIFEITIDDRTSGDFTFKLFGKLDHPDAGVDGAQDDESDILRLGFTYTVTDLDGDSVTGNFEIDVLDDAPVIGVVDSRALDEENIPGLNGNIGDSYGEGDDLAGDDDDGVDAEGGRAVSGSLGVNWGADNGEARSVSFNGMVSGQPVVVFHQAVEQSGALTHEGQTVLTWISADGSTMIGYVGVLAPGAAPTAEQAVFSVELSDAAAGSYSFTLFKSLDHKAGDIEDDIRIEFGFKATDSDGDSVTSSFSVTIDDDAPTIGEVDDRALDEENVPGLKGNVGDSYIEGDDLAGDDDDGVDAEGGRSASGSLGVNWGADNGEARSVAFIGVKSNQPIEVFHQRAEETGNLTHKGEEVLTWVSPDGSEIFGYVGTLAGEGGPSPDQIVFSAVLNDAGSGSYVFTLLKSLDHKVGDTEDDIRIDFRFKATDSDGDSVTSGFSITIDDDAPVASGDAVTLRVNENDIYTYLSQGTSPDEDSQWSWLVKGFAATARGSLEDVVDFGADGKADGKVFAFTENAVSTMVEFGLSSKSVALSYTIVGEFIVAFAGNRPVFSLQLDGETGDVVYRQYDQLDHVDANGQNVDLKSGLEESLGGIDFGSIIKALDGDGDSVTLDGKLTIQVTDDIPVVKIWARDTVTIDETDGRQYDDVKPSAVEGLFEGLDNVGSDEDMSAPAYARDNVVGFAGAIGADEGGSVKLSLRIVGPGSDSGLRTTDGSQIYLYQEGELVVGRVGGGNGPVAFAIAIEPNGDVSVAQYMSIKHPHTNSSDEWLNLSGKISAVVTVTDHDGDPVEKSVQIGDKINFRDDGPVALSGTLTLAADEDDIKTYLSEGTNPDEDSQWSWLVLGKAATERGSLKNLVDFGADGAAECDRFALTDDAVSEMTKLGLMSKSVVVSYVLVGEFIVAFAGERPVFSLQLDGETGEVVYRQYDQLDHIKVQGENFYLATKTGGSLPHIDFGKIIEATDGDGDSVRLTGKLNVTVQDDVPQLVGGKPLVVNIDEDDILTGGSTGTSPNDGAKDDDSYTGDPNTTEPGPAFISGSLAGLVKSGTDEGLRFELIGEVELRATLEAYGLKSQNGVLSYDIGDEGMIYAFVNKGGPGVVYNEGTDRLVFTLQIGQNGAYEFKLYDQLDHDRPAQGADENIDLQDKISGDVSEIDFGKVIQAIDHDGDKVRLDGAFKITITDDIPEVDAKGTNARLVVDETAGSDGGDNEVGKLSVFNGVYKPGNDPTMAYQYARQSGFVTADIKSGADENATGPKVSVSWALALNGQDGLDSGLRTTEGYKIHLFLENGIIVGRYDLPGGNQHVDKYDPAAFALHLDNHGTLSLVQYVSLKHDDRGDPDEANDNGTNDFDAQDFDLNDYPNPIQQTLAGKINAVVSVTDADGDTVKDTVEIGGRIVFEDDGPTINISVADEHKIVLETEDGKTEGYNVDYDYTTADFSGAFQLTFNGGADGATNRPDMRYDLELACGQGTDSGLTHEGQPIRLYEVGGVIFGSVGTGLHNVNIIFKIVVDGAGRMTLFQFDEIDHKQADTENFNTDVIELAVGLVKLTASAWILDGDGDVAIDSASIDLGGYIQFKDDGPSVNSGSISLSVDEDGLPDAAKDAQPTALAGEVQGTNSVTTSVTVADLKALFNFGADGAHASEAISLKAPASGAPELTSQGKPIQITVSSDGKTLTGTADGREVFTLKLSNDGSTYSFELKDQIDHPSLDGETGDNTESSLPLDLSAYIVGKDGDGDTVSLTPGKFVINVQDDIPSHTDETVCLEIDAPFVIDPVPAKVANIVLVLDTSGSIDDRLATMQSQVENLLKDLGGSGAKHVRVHIVSFADDAHTIGTYDLIKDGKLDEGKLAEAIGDVRELDEVGGTNYEAGMQQALQWIEGVASTSLTVNRASSFDANSHGGNGNDDTAYILRSGDTQIALVSGWTQTGSENGHLVDVNPSSEAGWGVDGQGLDWTTQLEADEILRFDFGKFDNYGVDAFDDGNRFDGVPVTSATFSLDDNRFDSGSTLFSYRVVFIDGSVETGSRDVNNGDTTLVLTGITQQNVGKQIAYVEFSTSGGGLGDVDLRSVVTATQPPGTIPNADINKVIFISDGEPNLTNASGNVVSASVAVDALDDEIIAIETAGNSGQKFTIEAFGIEVSQDGLKILDRVEGENGEATEIKGNETLSDVMKDLIGELGGTTGQPAGEVSKPFNLADLVKVGVDKDLTFHFKAGTDGSQVTLAGIALIYTIAGNVLTAKAADNTVFELEIEQDGDGKFTLYRPLGSEDVSVDFSSIIEAKDADGDSITLAANQFVVKIDAPDAPVANDDRIITNAGLNSEFSIPEWVLLANDEGDAALDITALTDREGLEARLGSGDQGIRVKDTGGNGGSFDYSITDGRMSAKGSVTVEQVQDLRGGSGDDIIIAKAHVTPTAQTTTIKFASSYDAGDVVSITVDGVKYSHVVQENGRTAEQVYDALKVEKIQGVTLEQSLASKGVRWANHLTKDGVTLTGDPGKANAFEISAEIDNSNDTGKPWTTTVDFENSISSFKDKESIAITLDGFEYKVSKDFGDKGNSGTNFDTLAESLRDELNKVDGIDAKYDRDYNKFTIETDFNSGTSTGTSTSNDKDAVVNTKAGYLPSDQDPPIVHTSSHASNGGYELHGLDGDDILIGSNGDDILSGGLGFDILTGGAGDDVFVFDEDALGNLEVADVITDFNNSGSDALDVSALLDSLLTDPVTELTAAANVRATLDGHGNTTVSVQTDLHVWKDVAVLQNHTDAVKILFDDKHSTTINLDSHG